MKQQLSCQQCRASKRKCLRPELGQPCTGCQRKQSTCSLVSRSQQRHRLKPIEIATQEYDDSKPRLSLPQELVEDLVEKYLHYLHDRPHTIFHTPTLRHNIRQRKVSPALELAICSLGCRFHSDPSICSLTSRLTVEAKRLLFNDIENICIENIQACILLAHITVADLGSSSEAIYYGVANRMAQILRINAPNGIDSFTEQETKRRIWWSLYMTDRWSSARSGLPRQLHDTERPIELPMDENHFHTFLETDNLIIPQWKPGLWAHMITLAGIFGPILDLNKRLVGTLIEENDLNQAVHQLAAKLEDWENSLPADVKESASNLMFSESKGQGGPFVALHLGYHHYSTLLYFQFLDPSQPVSESTRVFAQRCKNHSTSFSKLLKLSRDSENCEAVYAGVGHMTIVASSVLLHTLLFGDESETAEAKSNLSSNFECLVELKKFWPSVETMIKRLFIFQTACLQSGHVRTHKVDKWMLRFLLEHHLPLDEMPREPHESMITEGGIELSRDAEKLRERGILTENALQSLLN